MAWSLGRGKRHRSWAACSTSWLTERSNSVLWICYAHLRLIPVAIPIIVAIRGTIVDSLRSLAVSEGTTRSSPRAPWLGRSSWAAFMRSGYGIAKLVSFAGLAITNALAAQVALGTAALSTMATYQVIFNVVSWIAVGYCVVRGAPVIVEAIPALLAPGSSPASRNPVP